MPQDWTIIQSNLGNALHDQGIRAAGAQGTELLVQAGAAYRNALQVTTHEQLPQNWAMTQSNLGYALYDQGIRTEGSKGTELLAQAVVEAPPIELLPARYQPVYGNSLRAPSQCIWSGIPMLGDPLR